ncbi:MAG: YkvA family protein [Dehalococcoidia bacterium]|nr:YkvA family protein [Dehalococcoidia bacterium]|tara:strand:+ start:152 stop:523 length:372 start_codon:yes stop_codon:yes gene_type:complete
MFHRLAMPLLYFLAPRLLPKVIKFVVLVWRLTFDKRVSIFLRVLVPLAIVYVISPVDLLRDRVPIIGRFDDMIVFGLALLFLTKLASPAIVDEHMGVEPKSDRPEDKDPESVVDGTSRLIDNE